MRSYNTIVYKPEYNKEIKDLYQLLYKDIEEYVKEVKKIKKIKEKNKKKQKKQKKKINFRLLKSIFVRLKLRTNRIIRKLNRTERNQFELKIIKK